jgi:DNA replication protein DnaC
MAQLHSQSLSNQQYHECSHDEYLALLTDHEWEHRYNRKTQRLIQQANFRQKASVEEVSYTQARNLNKNMFHRLATLDFITKKENIIITGSSGVGKSYLVQALGYQACF